MNYRGRTDAPVELSDVTAALSTVLGSREGAQSEDDFWEVFGVTGFVLFGVSVAHLVDPQDARTKIDDKISIYVFI